VDDIVEPSSQALLPEQLVSVPTVPAPTIRDLTGPGLDRLPQREKAVDRIGGQLVAFVQERTMALLDVLLAGSRQDARLELALRRSPGRMTKVLLRSGLPSGEHLSTTTVGEVLDPHGERPDRAG